MFFHANDFQLSHLVTLIKETHLVYGPKKSGRLTVYDAIDKPGDIQWSYKRSVMSFKKILFPDGAPMERSLKKIAILGMPMCDIAALKIFLKQFKDSGLVPAREDIFIVGSSCQPDDNCFCDQFDLSRNLDYDLFLMSDSKGYLIQAIGWQGKELCQKCGLKSSGKSFSLKSKARSKKIDLKLTNRNIDNKTLTSDFWKKIGNNCFGCGACSTVCPLCYCFRQDYRSLPDGQDEKCLRWDSCFSADFSQIQFGHDLRPHNSDRLYNWYHHKFVRGPREMGDSLCVGCGRCITACPANLNIHNILDSLNKKYPERE